MIKHTPYKKIFNGSLQRLLEWVDDICTSYELFDELKIMYEWE